MAEQDVVEVMARAQYAAFFGDPGDTLVDSAGHEVIRANWEGAAASAKEAMRRMARAALTALEAAGYAVVKKKAEIVNFGGCTDGPYVPLAFGPNGETRVLDQIPESTGDRYTVTPIESETFTIDLLPDDPFKK